ncbi:type I glutamate--ammonia ligase [Candidatus Woesearchaeota archaeon]|nr:type I glutamate--ammonia ligase [Candidatus Woesearchaeota archaeon]
METRDVLQKIKDDSIEEINLIFTDFLGQIKSVTITSERVPEAFEKGIWFDGSSIEGFTRISESDMYLMPDPSTYNPVAWEQARIAQMMCDIFTPDGKPFEGDPRFILKRAISDANLMGYEYMVGPELEFFLFRNGDKQNPEPIPHDTAGYFDNSTRDQAVLIRREMVKAVTAMGIDVEMSHHEVADGQHEIDFKYGGALETADRVIIMKSAIKSIAQRHGTFASFMPKPIFGINGSGMHVHQSLFDRSGKNIFFDEKDSHKLSDTAKSFISGQFKHIKHITAVTNPTVNSYKRLVPGYEAPVYICWGQKNRSALIRIPRYSPGREQSTRAEIRCPDPSCNPYMAFAMMLWAGLDGIKRKLILDDPQSDDVYKFNYEERVQKGIEMLPGSLHDAVLLFEQGTITDKLGAETKKKYIKAKMKEWDSYRTQVTKWELNTYLPIV